MKSFWFSRSHFLVSRQKNTIIYFWMYEYLVYLYEFNFYSYEMKLASRIHRKIVWAYLCSIKKNIETTKNPLNCRWWKSRGELKRIDKLKKGTLVLLLCTAFDQIRLYIFGFSLSKFSRLSNQLCSHISYVTCLRPSNV